MMTQKELAEVVAKAWNTLDVKHIEPYLSDDYIYDSFWVLETMKGKENYIDYLKGKFDAIKKTGSKVDAGIVFQSKIDEYVVAIGQDGIRDAALQIWAKGGKITHMWMRPIDLVGLK